MGLYKPQVRLMHTWHKKILLIVGGILAVGLLAIFATPVKADIETGLVGKWKLDEGTGTTAADISGNGNDGTLVRNTGTSPAWVTPGHDGTGAALEFDGAGAQTAAANTVDVGNSAVLDQLSDYTLSVWVKFEDGYVGNGGGWANLVGRNSSGADWAWMLYVRNDGHIRAHHKTGSTPVGYTTSYNPVPTDQWVHIEQVASNGELNLYINGEKAADSFSYTGSTVSLPNAHVYIGQDTREYAPLATISEVSIYNKGRTAPGGVTGDLQLWMRGDSGVADTSPISSWADFSGNGNTGTATGDPSLSSGAVNFNDTVNFEGAGDGFNTNLDIDPARYPDLAVFSVYKPTADPAGAVWGSDDGNWNRLYGQLGSCTGTSDGTGCVTVPDSFSPNEWRLSSTVFDEGTTNGSSAYVNGELGATFTSNHGPEANANFKIGQVGNDSSYFNGDIAEVIVYNQLLDGDNGRQRVESYLATRYGITLGDIGAPIDYFASDGTAFWTGSATYQNDVAGIGRDDTSPLDQRQSKSENSGAFVTMGNGTIAADNDSNPNGFADNLSFMMWGNNDASTDVVNDVVSVNGTNFKRMERIWSIQETGTVGTAKLQIPQAELDGASPTLLVSNDETFDNTDTQIALTANGTTYEADVNFTDGQFFTFAVEMTTPQVTTDVVSAVEQTSATLDGTLNTGDFTPDNVFFRYRIQGSGNPFTETAAQQMTSSGSFSANIVGLDPSTTYEYKAVVQWEDGGTQEAEGSLVTFTTFDDDGTPACAENNVDCFVNPVTNTNVKLVVDDACTITTAEMKPETDMNIADPDGFDYPLGLMDFRLECGTPGYTTTVTQYHYDVTNDNYILRKHNPNTEIYFTVDEVDITQMTLGGQVATVAAYQITDGGDLDIDNAANGTIVDPTGLAYSTAQERNSGTLPNTGQNIWAGVAAASLLIITGLSALYRRSLMRFLLLQLRA